MKEIFKKIFGEVEYSEEVGKGEKFSYKLLRVTGWVAIILGGLFHLGVFAGVEWLIYGLLMAGLGVLCLALGNWWIKKVDTPEYREKVAAERNARQAGWAGLGAVAKELISPSATVSTSDEPDIEENYEESTEFSESNETQPDYICDETTENTGGKNMINKNMNSLTSHLGSISKNAAAALPDILSSMNNDEEILYAFKSMMLERNHGKPGRDSITDTVNILTNKRYYFAGTDGQSAIFAQQQKSGSVSLRDVHATNAGTITLQGAYVGFETRNDDYKIWLGAGVKSGPVKAWFDEAIRKAEESSTRGGNTIQAAFSPADELKKFKELLDMGVITQDEFDAKKKQLLGL